MQIHVARNSAQLGIFAPEEILAGLQSGRFLSSDLAWRDGLPAWTPLGDWAEFRGVGVPPPSPGAAPAEAPVASMIPWEQGKSLGSFFATIKQSVASPSILSTGRYAFGDWLVFCYVGVLISLPFQTINILVFGDKNAQLADMLRSLNIPEVSKAAERMAHADPTPVWVTLFGTVMGLAFVPLMYAFFALLHWVGQRIFRFRISVERTAAATLLASTVLAVLMAPLQLLGFSFGLQMVLSVLLLVPGCVIYYRAFGAVTGMSPWVQFGIDNFVWFVLCCCCCAAPLSLIGLSAAKAAGH